MQQKKVDGPILVSADQIEAAFSLANEFITNTSKGDSHSSASIYIYLKDDETYVVDNFSDALNIPNKSGNRIQRIRVKAGIYDPSITISLGSSYAGRVGAAIEVTGQPNINQKYTAKFKDIFDNEKDIFSSILSTHPLLLLLVLVTSGHYLLGFLSSANLQEISSWLSIDKVWYIVPYLMMFWLSPMLALGIVLELIFFRWIGSAIFMWGDGETSYNKKKFILTTAFATIPLGIFINVISKLIE